MTHPTLHIILSLKEKKSCLNHHNNRNNLINPFSKNKSLPQYSDSSCQHLRPWHRVKLHARIWRGRFFFVSSEVSQLTLKMSSVSGNVRRLEHKGIGAIKLQIFRASITSTKPLSTSNSPQLKDAPLRGENNIFLPAIQIQMLSLIKPLGVVSTIFLSL